MLNKISIQILFEIAILVLSNKPDMKKKQNQLMLSPLTSNNLKKKKRKITCIKV